MAVVRQLMQNETGVLLVTHDVREIPPEIDRVVLMQEGRVLADGKKREVLTPDSLSLCYGVKLRVNWRDGLCEVRPAVER